MVLALTQLSCDRESRVDWATRNKILMVGNGSEPKALDPHLVCSVGDSNILQNRQRLIVENVSVIIQNTAVAMVGIFAQAHVGDDDDVAVRRFDRPNRLLDDAIGREIFCPHAVFLIRDTEKEDGRDVQPTDFINLTRQLVNGQPVLTRHGANFTACIRSVLDEKWIDEVVDGERCLLHHVAQCGGVAQAARPDDRKCHAVSMPKDKGSNHRVSAAIATQRHKHRIE